MNFFIQLISIENIVDMCVMHDVVYIAMFSELFKLPFVNMHKPFFVYCDRQTHHPPCTDSIHTTIYCPIMIVILLLLLEFLQRLLHMTLSQVTVSIWIRTQRMKVCTCIRSRNPKCARSDKWWSIEITASQPYIAVLNAI